MTSSWLSPQPILCGRIHFLRPKTCFVLIIFLVTISIVLSLLNGDRKVVYSDVSAGKSGQKIKLKSRLSLANAENVVHNPLKYLNSRTVGPRCDSFLLMVVTSAPGNVERRKWIRNTWARRNVFNRRYDWQYVFAIGRSLDDQLQSQVANEMNQHNDILYADFVDTYRNLTTKVLNALAWAKYQCHGTRFVMKTDDDCYVNTVILPRLIQDHHAEASALYLGRVFTRTSDLLVLRSEENQWSLSKAEYSESSYPPYASGTGYMLSMDLVDAVLNRSRYMKPFPVEDAYLGVLIAALDVEPVHSGRFTFQAKSWNLCNFFYLLVIHHVTKEDQEKFQQMALEAQTKCHEPFITKWN